MNKRKLFKKVCTVLFIIMFFISIIFYKEIINLYNIFEKLNYEETKIDKAKYSSDFVVVGQNDNSLYLASDKYNERFEIYECEIPSNSLEKVFYTGQEVMVGYEKIGKNPEKLYGTIYDVTYINVLKDETDKVIPDDVYRIVLSSIDNVTVDIEELTKEGIKFKINDINDYQYEFTDDFRLFQASLNRYHNDGTVTLSNYVEVHPNFEIGKEVCVRDDNEKEVGFKSYDWSKYYKTLEPGHYMIQIPSREVYLKIGFVVNSDGKAVHYKTNLQDNKESIIKLNYNIPF